MSAFPAPLLFVCDMSVSDAYKELPALVSCDTGFQPVQNAIPLPSYLHFKNPFQVLAASTG
jgi:hypothetical protein